MGFWSSVCSAASSFCSGVSSVCRGIGSAVKSCFSAVGGIASSVGSMIKNCGAVATVLGRINPYISSALTVLMICSSVAKIVGVACQLIKPQEQMDDLGERVLQADEQGISLESCHNDFTEYMEKIRSMKLDPEKAAQHTMEQKLSAGFLLVEKGLSTIKPELQVAPLLPLCLIAPKITEERLKAWTDYAMKTGTSLGSIAKFFLGDAYDKLYPESAGDTRINSEDGRKAAVNAEKELSPQSDDLDIGDNINKVKKDIEDGLKKLAETEQKG